MTDVSKREKSRARSAVQLAVKFGLLVRPITCSACGKEDCRIQGHHADYGKPLEVEWVCQACHNVRHSRPRVVAAEHTIPIPVLLRVRELAESKGIPNAHRLAQACGLHPNVASQFWKDPNATFTRTTLDKLCEGLDVSVTELFVDSGATK